MKAWVWLLALGLVAPAPVQAAVVFADKPLEPGNQQGIARWILQGRHVANVGGYDNRLLEKHLIRGMARCPEVVVIGSSRLFELRSNQFPGRRFFNNSVGLATIQDLMAIYGLYREREMAPGLAVLGLDPWMLNRHSGLDRWHLLEEHFEAIDQLLTLPAPQVASARLGPLPRVAPGARIYRSGLVTPTRRRLPPGSTYYPTFYPFNEGSRVILADGSLLADKPMLTRKPADIRYSAIYHFTHKTTVREFVGFRELDAEALRRLEGVLDLLRADGVQPVLALAPFHPAAYAIIAKSSRYKIAVDAETAIRRLARRLEVPVIGSYDPVALGVGEDEFYDAVHPKESAVAKLFRVARRKGVAL